MHAPNGTKCVFLLLYLFVFFLLFPLLFRLFSFCLFLSFCLVTQLDDPCHSYSVWIIFISPSSQHRNIMSYVWLVCWVAGFWLLCWVVLIVFWSVGDWLVGNSDWEAPFVGLLFGLLLVVCLVGCLLVRGSLVG